MKKLVGLIVVSFALLFLFSNTAKAAGPICDESKLNPGDDSGTNGIVPCGKGTIPVWYYRIREVGQFPPTTKTTPVTVLCVLNNGTEEMGYTVMAQNIAKGMFSGSTSASCAFIEKTPGTNDCKYFCSVTVISNINTVISGTVQADSENNARDQAQVEANKLTVGAITATVLGVNQNGEAVRCPCELGHVFILAENIYDFILWDVATPLAVLLIIIGGILLLISGGNPGLAGTAKGMLKWTVIALCIMFGSWLIIDLVLKAIGYNLPWANFVF